ncbi:Similar to Protein ariadne-2; acc. no. O76924 [Pyronema omphalodes CBS 100304]|uniref:RBR-type E3 ubiquitin transferase n=1 Tax=Pyronema omphalodes (strain CBS 100304) TaxID=1076935 RepID=U4L797_PYROM|nr:Similar to Protein ariadne-2; acc. no. O76924 [Pyronema omphalodes CBS 100304]
MAYYPHPQRGGYAGQNDEDWDPDLVEEQRIILESFRLARERFPPPPPPPPVPRGPREEARDRRNYDQLRGGGRAKTPDPAPRRPFPKQGGRSHTPGPHQGIGRNRRPSPEPELPKNNGSRGKAAPPAKKKDVDCTACMDTIEGDVFMTPCKHPYCFDCLQHMARSSIAGETGSFPPTCCKQPLPTDLVKKVLTRGDWKKFEEKLKDKEDKLNLFCPKANCSTRLTKRDVKGETGTCPKCSQKICTKCKGVEHRGICKENELTALAKKERWKGCPTCGRVIEKEPGTCNKMHCVCGQYYCYRCGKTNTGRYEDNRNGGCNCPVWDREDLDIRQIGIRDGRINPWANDGIPVAQPHVPQGQPAGWPGLGWVGNLNPINPIEFPRPPGIDLAGAGDFLGDNIFRDGLLPVARAPLQWGGLDVAWPHVPQPNPPLFRPFVPAPQPQFNFPRHELPPGFVWADDEWLL